MSGDPDPTHEKIERRRTRAEIDNLTVKGLLTINGGGAVAILAFLPTVFETQGLDGLFPWILGSLACFLVGLVLAVCHNHLRRKCSQAHEARAAAPPNERDDRTPRVCVQSRRAMKASGISFLVGGVVVVLGGACVWWTALRA